MQFKKDIYKIQIDKHWGFNQAAHFLFWLHHEIIEIMYTLSLIESGIARRAEHDSWIL